MNCPSCGTPNADGALNCAQCGAALAAPGQGDPVPAAGTPAPMPPGPPPAYGPPGGPPPAGGPPGPPPGGAPPPGRGRRGLLVPLAILAVVALAAAGLTFALTRDGDDADEVVLEPLDMVQEDDFAGNLDVGEGVGAVFASLEPDEGVPDARVEQAETRLAGHVVEGSEPAVYGGSRDTRVCDVAALTEFLTDPANAGKAAAWAAVQGIEVGEIEDYIGGLTAVRLRWDTRVTNHGFRDGEATPFQSLLQAGTAVLVDDTGVPRVKCNCGNPLGEPGDLGGASAADAMALDDLAQNPDQAWEGLDPAEAVRILPGGQVDEITLVDVDTGGLIERPVGSDGASEPDVGTGDVQVTLSWSSDADLDLAVTEPDGTGIDYLSPGPSGTGGELDVDSNVGCGTTGSGVENVFWNSGDAPSGRYTVTVTGFRLFRDDGSDCGSGEYTLDITVAGEGRRETGAVAQDEVQTYTFEVP
ncbi:MAG TPA: DUF6777 domain-containing protein [Acidimicrobiales bacterium]